ncbi:hypothetical protein QQI_1760 [Clostridioides difficile Y401]|nr:hypothetical protein QQI_1760 [Clostridioides difficile Y401]
MVRFIRQLEYKANWMVENCKGGKFFAVHKYAINVGIKTRK